MSSEEKTVFLLLSAVLSISALIVSYGTEHFYYMLYIVALFFLTAIPLLILCNNRMPLISCFIIFPALIASLDIFFFRQGLFNIFAYLDGTLFSKSPIDYIYKAMILVLCGNFLMWAGFFWKFARDTGDRLGRRISALTTISVRPRVFLIYIIFAIGVGARLYIITKGLGGYFSYYASRASALPYIQFLNLLEELTTLSLLSFFCICLKSTRPNWLVFISMLAIDIVTVLLLGFKSPIFYVFFYLAILVVFIAGRSPLKLIILGLTLLILIVPVNLMARDQFIYGRLTAGKPLEIAKAFFRNAKIAYDYKAIFQSTSLSPERIARMSSNLEIFALVMQYADTGKVRFYGKDFIHIFIWAVPRAVWPTKPVVDSEWVSVEIYGHERPTTTATSPTLPGQFYIDFGMVGYLAAFFVYGMMQRIACAGISKVNSLRYAPLIAYIVVFLAMTPANLGAGIGNIIRTTLFNIVVLIIIFPKSNVKSRLKIGSAELS